MKIAQPEVRNDVNIAYMYVKTSLLISLYDIQCAGQRRRTSDSQGRNDGPNNERKRRRHSPTPPANRNESKCIHKAVQLSCPESISPVKSTKLFILIIAIVSQVSTTTTRSKQMAVSIGKYSCKYLFFAHYMLYISQGTNFILFLPRLRKRTERV